MKKQAEENFVDVVKIIPITYRKNYSKVLFILANTDLYLVITGYNNKFIYDRVNTGLENIRYNNDGFDIMIGGKYISLEIKKLEKVINKTKYLKYIIK